MLTSYALAATLDSYEVKELDVLQLARFLRNEHSNKEALREFLAQLDRQITPKAA